MDKYDAGQKQYSQNFDKQGLEHAINYENIRYYSNRRGRRLNLLDQKFAGYLLALVGHEAHIVDVPCGTGRFFNVFSRAGKLSMVDYSQNMLQVVRERYGEHDHVKYLQGDIKVLPLEDGSADLCFSMRYFHHLDNDEIAFRVLRELARVSKKYVAISFYNKNSYKYWSRKLRGKGMSGYYFRYETLTAIAEKANLRIVKKIPRWNFKEQHTLLLLERA